MKNDPLSIPLFEMRLDEIHRADPWLRYEISINDFIALFPIRYKNGRPVKPEHPATASVPACGPHAKYTLCVGEQSQLVI